MRHHKTEGCSQAITHFCACCGEELDASNHRNDRHGALHFVDGVFKDCVKAKKGGAGAGAAGAAAPAAAAAAPAAAPAKRGRVAGGAGAAGAAARAAGPVRAPAGAAGARRIDNNRKCIIS
jgi:hypothetical protein